MAKPQRRGAEAAETRRRQGTQIVREAGSLEIEASTLPLKFRIARRLGALLGWYSTESTAIRASKPLLGKFVAVADDASFVRSLGLEPSFAAWHSVMVLQTWMYLTRLRTEGDAGKTLRQSLFDQLWEEVEAKVRTAGITQESIVARSVKELIQTFYGAALAYDEGVACGSDAVLASAVWRNVYSMQRNIEVRDLYRMVAYIRSELARLQAAPSADVFRGDFVFATQLPGTRV